MKTLYERVQYVDAVGRIDLRLINYVSSVPERFKDRDGAETGDYVQVMRLVGLLAEHISSTSQIRASIEEDIMQEGLESKLDGVLESALNLYSTAKTVEGLAKKKATADSADVLLC